MLREALALNRPLAVFDLETTGLNAATDRIVQIAITIHYPDKDPIEWCSLVNPGVPIPDLNHGITSEAVQDAPKFVDFAESLHRSLEGCDLAGHNVEDFDFKVLHAEFNRAGIKWEFNGLIIDTLTICRRLDGHTLENAYKRYVDRNGFEGAHHAGRDVAATTAVLFGQLNYFVGLPRTVEELYLYLHPPKVKDPNWVDSEGKVAFDKEGVACITFGKWKGTPLQKIPTGYLNWMIGSGGFSDELVLILSEVKKGNLPKKS